MRGRLIAITAMAAALDAAEGQPSIPVRALAPVTAKTTETIGSLAGFKQLPDGRVLVNDQARRRLVVFSPALNSFTVSADSGRTGPAHYTGSMITGLYSYVGDSVLWADAEAQVFIVIAPDGQIARVLAHPKPLDLTNLYPPNNGRPGSDAQGRFIYRAKTPVRPPRGTVVDSSAAPPTRDTMPIVRANFDTRAVDTVAFFTIPRGLPTKRFTDANGKTTATMYVNPAPVGADDWAVLSDGSVAVVRAHDYHIDWLYADGTRASTPKMAFDWRRLTDQDKKAKIDSVRRFADSLLAAGQHWGTLFLFTPDGNGGTKRDSIFPSIDFVPLDAMADYVQPLRRDGLKPDEDGNLWILPATSSLASGGLLYDVVNRKGEIFERVQLPKGRDIAGFGKGGVVYLIAGDRTVGYRIEKTKVLRPSPRPDN